MAYNKSKYVETAQKLLNQGKVTQAIAEYQNILRFEPRDQVTLMTIGELYIRQGETFQAIDYFERLAQIFVGDGFLTKAIAVYKRIAKLAPEEIRPLEKLADLYVQQGVMSEARPLFLQLAEIHLKERRQPEAVGLLRKLLQAEPDNLRIQIRLADLYQAMGQSRDAIEAYVSASQRALARGDQAESEKLADKALKLEPANLGAMIVKARSQSTQGNFEKAAQLLEKVPDLEKGGEQTELLLDMYVKGEDWDKATALAVRVFEADGKNYGPMQKAVESLVQMGQTEMAMKILERSRIPMIDAGAHEVVGKLLAELAASMPGSLEPLEWLVELYGRTSDSFRLPEALTQLGDALAEHKQYGRARQVFEQLVSRDPENDSAKGKLNDVLQKMGFAEQEASEPETVAVRLKPEVAPEPLPGRRATEEAVPEIPVSASEPLIETSLDEATQRFITQSLTDVDLFASYGLTQKAIGLLEAVLRRAPRHTPSLEKLLDFVLGSGDDRRTAELSAQLERIHGETGDQRSAERFGELRRRFQRAAGLSDEELASAVAPPPSMRRVEQQPPEMAVPEIFAEPPPDAAAKAVPAEEEGAPPPVESIAAPESQEVQEVDLSDEWASLLDETRQGSPAAEPATKEPGKQKAQPTPEPVEEPSGIEEFQISAEPAATPGDAPQAGSFDLEGAGPAAPDEPKTKEVPLEPPPAKEPIKIPEAKETRKPAKAPEPRPEPQPEFELEQEYELVLDPEPLVPAYDQKPPETPIAPPAPEPVAKDSAAPAAGGEEFASDQFLADLAKEIEDLGIGELAPALGGPGPQQPASAESSPLKEVFEEFRAELGEMGAEEEDLETHYNLGIAFREMGLLEEAIGEFQKVAKASERGRAFRYTMQCCTLLGLAFMEKGQPAIAAIWYERALQTPDMDPESTLALRYDLGVAQESAGELDAALKSFFQVYAMNIDYRDVAERIAALQKPIR